jgi:hypothetical protein
MNDFRNLQYYLVTLHAQPAPEDYYLEGYAVLRQSIADGQAVLASQYSHTAQHPQGDVEVEKAQLRM